MSTPGRPWDRLETEVLVDNPWHRYCRDRYVCPDSSEGRYYYIDMAGSCGTIPVFDDGTTCLVRVHRYLLGRALWEFPIGGMRPGEDPATVARKELREEAGLLAGRLDPIGRFAPYKGVSNEICHFFVARDLEWTSQDLEPSEEISVHRVSIDEARRLLVDQEVGDGQSLVGLLYFERWRARTRDA